MNRPPDPVGDSIAAKILIIQDSARNIAKIARINFNALRAEGFAPHEALNIVIALLTAPPSEKRA